MQQMVNGCLQVVRDRQQSGAGSFEGRSMGEVKVRGSVHLCEEETRWLKAGASCDVTGGAFQTFDVKAAFTEDFEGGAHSPADAES